MHPREGVKRVGSHYHSWGVGWHGLAAVGALAICFAAALNVGPFAKVSQREALGTIDQRPAESVSIPRQQISVGTQGDRFKWIEATYAPDPNRSLIDLSSLFIQLSSISDTAAARLGSGPKHEEADGAIQAEQMRQDSESPDPAAQVRAAIVGIWAPDKGACSKRDLREGLLPAVINTEGAWAGETVCIFKNQRQTKADWRVVADCSNPREQWTANVRLAVKGDRLIWTSKRGTQAYARCARDVLMAETR